MTVGTIALALAASLAAAGSALSAGGRPGDSAADELNIRHRDSDLAAYAVTDPAGNALFGFDVTPTSPEGGYAPDCQGPADRGYLGFRNSNGALVSLGRFDELQAPPVITARRAAILVASRNCRRPSADAESILSLRHLRVRRGPLGRRPAVITHLSDAAEAFSATAVASRGRLAVAWLDAVGGRRPERDILRISLGGMRGSLSRPIVLAGRGFVSKVRLAWMSDGELLVVYAVDDRVVLRTWKPGRSFSHARVLGRIREGNTQLSVAVGPGGRAVIAWGSQAHGIEPDSPWVIQAAVRSGRSRSFDRTRVLDRGDGRREPVTDVTTAVGRDGVASIAWSSARAGNPIEVVSVDRTGRFGAPQRLASTARYITGIVGQDDGGSLLQWEETGALREASREPGSTAFGAASPADTRADLLEGAVLIDARTGS